MKRLLDMKPKVIDEIVVANNRLQMLSTRSVYWVECRSLIVADLHLGYRSHGRNLRQQELGDSDQSDLDLASDLRCELVELGATRLIVLGDLWHKGTQISPPAFDAFAAVRIESPTLSFTLIRGNHDPRTPNPTQNFWQIGQLVRTEISAPFLLSHYPQRHSEYFCLCGHLHPATKNGTETQTDCFVLERNCLILPARNPNVRRRIFEATDETKLFSLS